MEWFVCFMVFNAIFNNISVISWRSVLLVEETGAPRENHRTVTSHWKTKSHNVVHLPWSRFELTTSMVIGTDCIGSCKSNYHTIMATTVQFAMKNYYCLEVKTIYVYLFLYDVTYTNITSKILSKYLNYIRILTNGIVTVDVKEQIPLYEHYLE